MCATNTTTANTHRAAGRLGLLQTNGEKPPHTADRLSTAAPARLKNINLAKLKDLLRPLRAGWLKRDGRYQCSECFLPCPKITFLIDKPRNLICQICSESHLGLRTDRLRLTDRTPAILPCGHVAGLRCLGKWFSTQASSGDPPCCPFCRTSLEYRGCGHKVPERPITLESVHLLPSTLPDGGEIPDLCWECSRPGARVAARERFEICKSEFLAARNRAFWTGQEADELALVQRKKDFETAVVEDHCVNQMTSLLARW